MTEKKSYEMSPDDAMRALEAVATDLLRENNRLSAALAILANEDSYKPYPDSVALQVINIAKTALRVPS